MALKISAENTDFEVLEAGEHIGVCYKIIDAGTREETWKDNPPKKRKSIFVTWEVPSQPLADGRPFSISKKYTASLNENATLYKDLVTWRGRPFSNEDLKGFDVSKMVGAPAMLHVEHTDEGRARIKAIFKPDNFKITETVNPKVIFDLDVYCNEFNGKSDDESKKMCEMFDTIPEWQQGLIHESFEFIAASKSAPVPIQPTASAGLSSLVEETVEEIEIPF
jgi:hypothetical protein|tara:strand:- start:390 stop:1055 length:666 start_codon:yes stop_codon:yes gene_type:complete